FQPIRPAENAVTVVRGHPAVWRRRRRLDGPPVRQSDTRVRVHQPASAPQGPGGEGVVRGEQEQVLAVRPLQTLVVCRDVALVGGVATVLDPRVRSGQGPSDLRCVVGRGVINDQYLDIDPVLVQDATNALLQEAAIVVTRDDHVYTGHWTLLHSDGVREARVGQTEKPSQRALQRTSPRVRGQG